MSDQPAVRGYRPSDHPDAEMSWEERDRYKRQHHRRKMCGSHPNQKSKAKLTTAQVKWARDNWNQGLTGTMSIVDMAKHLGLSSQAMSNVVNRMTYREVE